ncbi:GPW/gp25 family protein [Erythrobacter sp. THAF29]|uniref:GPW/gp25 family protein n=1 Tax=Erythrobacter sp. THAF29 TaxID=2587851 RepID=UPI001268A4C6|nr:GPW/gp25 family protein [Erythrobacter sp. THAF29]QFT76046.1 Gene 25-like lysozyme [Erythrobacter sp. THAF29]
MSRGWMFLFGAGGGLREMSRGSPRLVEGDRTVRQALMMLLGTRPGERVMRPEWGCPLHRVLFQPNDGATAGLAIHYVRQSIARHEPRVEVRSVTAAADRARPECLDIRLEYRVRTTGNIEQLRFLLDLQAEEAA